MAETMPDGIPWWAWLIGVTLIVGIPGVCTVAVALITRPLRRDAAQASESAQNAAASAAHAATELTPNHGSSTHDAIARVERSLADITSTVADVKGDVGDVKVMATATAKDVGGLREEIRTERLERISLAARLER